MADASRDRMMGEIASSAGNCADGDASAKVVLARGCDPVMAERSGKMLPPMLGNVGIVAVTDDDAFFAKLAERKFDVVLFAPGACRYDAARQPIPGGNAATAGWTLANYRATQVRASYQDCQAQPNLPSKTSSNSNSKFRT